MIHKLGNREGYDWEIKNKVLIMQSNTDNIRVRLFHLVYNIASNTAVLTLAYALAFTSQIKRPIICDG